MTEKIGKEVTSPEVPTFSRLFSASDIPCENEVNRTDKSCS